MRTPKLPKTDSIKELAKFWQTHDVTDFEDELEEVTEPVFERDTAIKLRLKSSDAEMIRRIARSKGMSEEALVRTWVLKNLPRRNGRRMRRHPTKS